MEEKLDRIIELLEEISDRLYEQPIDTRLNKNKFITKEELLRDKEDK